MLLDQLLRMEVAPDLSYPVKILLGRILEEGLPVEGTQLLIEVVEFEEK